MQVMAPAVVTETTNLFFPVLLLLLLVYIIIIIKHFKPSSPLKEPPLPPGPYPWPILGNILHMGKKPHISLTHYAKSYGPIISLRLGTQVLIVGSSPEVASEILKTHDRFLSARYVPHILPTKKPEQNKLSMAWSFECGDRWKYLRTICRTELFSGKAIESQACVRGEKIMEMVHFLEKMEGKAVNVGEVVFATVFNMLSSVLLSQDFISLKEEGGEMKGLVRAAMEMAIAPNLADFYWVFSGLDLQNLQRKFKDLLIKTCFMWEHIIKERREKKGGDLLKKSDFLDVMIENGFADDQINQLLLELFSAGTDTSTTTIEWAMTELIRNPKSMKKVREELKEVIINQDTIKESNLHQLPDLQACVKETLRLHPPAPLLLPHRAVESCKVMNYTVPKNSQVMINVWAIGRDPLIWNDPLLFKPERFLCSNLNYEGHDFEFLPFGSGRRLCPGLPLAARQVPLVLASLIHFFDWSLPYGINPNELDMSEKFGVTLQKEQPLLLIPKIRKHEPQDM